MANNTCWKTISLRGLSNTNLILVLILQKILEFQRIFGQKITVNGKIEIRPMMYVALCTIHFFQIIIGFASARVFFITEAKCISRLILQKFKCQPRGKTFALTGP